MLNRLILWLLTAFTVNSAVIAPEKYLAVVKSQSTCACTQTVTSYVPVELQRRDTPCPSQPPPVTVTVTVAPPEATLVGEDPYSVSTYFASVAALDTIIIQESSQNRPVNEPPQTTSIFFTHTVSGNAAFGTDDPNDGLTLYHFVSTGKAPMATTTVSFPPAGPVKTGAQASGTSTSTQPPKHGGTVTITTYLSTVTVPPPSKLEVTSAANLSVTARNLQKRQTCSMIYAMISGAWASWCNNWDGTSVLTQSIFNTTVFITNPVGAPPIPASVYNPSGTTSSSSMEVPTSTSSPTSIPKPPMQPSTTVVSTTILTSSETPMSTSTPTSIPSPPASSASTGSSQDKNSTSSTHSVATSVVVTASVVITYPVTTVTQTIPDSTTQSVMVSMSSRASGAPEASASCGQVGQFIITFDNLPRYSTKNPNDTDSPPIFDPYDHFYWSSGYGYGPPPNTPYTPNDGDRLAMYFPAEAVEFPTASTEGRDLPGSFGAGLRAFNNIFWFDAKSVFVGCNGTATGTPCNIVATGYRWIASTAANSSANVGHEELVFTQEYSTPPLCASIPCPLTRISFDPIKFSGLSSINIAASRGGAETGFFFDSFEAVWTNSSCAAGLERISSRK